LPGIVHTLKQAGERPGENPTMLVLLPTRELAQQVAAVAREYCQLVGLKVVCLFGGGSRGKQVCVNII
jgi:superfamily II DNA/RNA helicase